MADRLGGVGTNHIRARQVMPLYLSPKAVVWKNSSFENEALKNEDRSTKHPNFENEAPKSRKWSTYWKRSTQKRSTQNLKPLYVELTYNFTSSMTQSESGGGSGYIRTYKGRQNPSQGFMKACQLFNWTFLDRISCINFIIIPAILDASYHNMHFFRYPYMFM